MTPHIGQKISIIHILSNISRSKENRQRQFYQLLDYNMRNIFLEIPYTKCGGEASPRLFLKKSKFMISPREQSKML